MKARDSKNKEGKYVIPQEVSFVTEPLQQAGLIIGLLKMA